jgi:hypothetical protein
MIPNDVEEFQTEGESAFFRFLQSVAKPDSTLRGIASPQTRVKHYDLPSSLLGLTN